MDYKLNKNLRTIFRICLVFVAYFVTAKIGLSLKPVSGFATLVWPPTGIALAAILFWGYEMSIGIALAAFAVNYFIIGGPIAAILGIMIGNTLEAVTGVYLLNRFAGFDKSLDRVSDVIGFVLFGSFLATIVSATIGTTSLLVNHALADSYMDTWLAWWVGDSLGVLVAGSFLLAWAKGLSFRFDLEKTAELILLILFSLFLDLAIFTNLIVSGGSTILSLNYLLILPIIWAATRFNQRGATLVVIITDIVAIYGTTQMTGPFSGGELSANLLQLEVFMFIIAAVGLIISSAKAELDTVQAKYKKLSEELEEKVNERTALLTEAQRLTHMGSWEWDIATNKVSWTQEVYNVFGLEPDAVQPTYEDFLAYIHPDDRKRVDVSIKDSVRTLKSFEFEHRIVRPDGQERLIYGQGEVVVDGRNQPIAIRGIERDITEIKNTELILKKRNEELEKINRFMIDRESKMAELKKAIADLQAKAGK